MSRELKAGGGSGGVWVGREEGEAEDHVRVSSWVVGYQGS